MCENKRKKRKKGKEKKRGEKSVDMQVQILCYLHGVNARRHGRETQSLKYQPD
jgi:hypothetical protein